MSTATYAGTPVEVDGEGFMTDPQQWTREIGARDRRRERDRPAH